MSLFKKDIKSVKDEQVILVKCQKTIKDLIKNLSNQVTTYIQNEWDETFPGVKVHFLSGFEGGCMTDNWIANVYFYSIENKDFYRGGFYTLGRPFDFEVIKVEPPIPIIKLRSFIKRMNKETGVKCQMCNSSYVKQSLAGKLGLCSEEMYQQ